MLHIVKGNEEFGRKIENPKLVLENGDVRVEIDGIPPVEILEKALEFLEIGSPSDILEAALEADSLEGILRRIEDMGRDHGVEKLVYVDEPSEFGRYEDGVRIPLISATSGNLGGISIVGNPSPEFILKFLAIVDAITSISEGYILTMRGREMLESALDVLAEALEKRVKGGEEAKRIREEIFERAGDKLYENSVLKLALRVYDVGKIGVRDSILMKLEWEMDPVEFEEYKRHPLYGYEILKNIGELPREILDAVLYHHERIDGSGYPHGLRGKEIPRIAIVVGALDELSTRLAYGESLKRAIEKMEGKFPEDVLEILEGTMR